MLAVLEIHFKCEPSSLKKTAMIVATLSTKVARAKRYKDQQWQYNQMTKQQAWNQAVGGQTDCRMKNQPMSKTLKKNKASWCNEAILMWPFSTANERQAEAMSMILARMLMSEG